MSDDPKITDDGQIAVADMPPLDEPTNTPNGLVYDLFAEADCVDLKPRSIHFGPHTHIAPFYLSLKGLTEQRLVQLGVVAMLSALIDRTVADSEERHVEDENVRIVHTPDAIANASQSAIPLARAVAQLRGVPFIEIGPRGEIVSNNLRIDMHVALVDDSVVSGNDKMVKHHSLRDRRVHCNDLYVVWNRSMIKYRHISVADKFDMHELYRATTFFIRALEIGCIDEATATRIANYLETYKIA